MMFTKNYELHIDREMQYGIIASAAACAFEGNEHNIVAHNRGEIKT